LDVAADSGKNGEKRGRWAGASQEAMSAIFTSLGRLAAKSNGKSYLGLNKSEIFVDIGLLSSYIQNIDLVRAVFGPDF
jgi:hypothetical protein